MSNCKNWYSRGGKSYNKPYKKAQNTSNNEGGSTAGNEKENTQIHIDAIFEVENSPYNGWKFYFTEEGYKENNNTHQKIQAFEKYIERNPESFSLDTIEEKKLLTVDLKKLLKDEFISDWPSFENDLNTLPEHSLNCLGLAMHQTVYKKIDESIRNNTVESEEASPNLPKIHIRVLNHSPIIQLKNLKVNYYGKLASVRGTIIKVSNVKLICPMMSFKCCSCDAIQVVNQPDGVYTLPSSCRSKLCKNCSKFIPELSSSQTITNNWQLLKLQESIGSENSEGGRVPRTVECELTNDLVDCCTPGDDVTITGIIRVRNQEEFKNKNKQASMFLLYIDVISVVNNKNQTKSATSAIEFSLTDYYAIEKIHAEPALFKLLVHSLCPLIYGHEVVKAGLLLGLMGGSSQKNSLNRPDIHVLVVGDPGLGKSQMLQSCCNVAARGVFVCGNTSTSSGLTVTMTREAGGEYALEAGALVLADRGCCCIDEFDKMTANHATLLEAMEQQTISIAKAGVVCELPARTLILAAANPVGGHYNKAKTVAENLRLGAALLSRFDLVFILLDKPDKHLDSLLSEHVLALHAGLKRKKCGTNSGITDSTQHDPTISLKERLALLDDEDLDVIPHQLLRKYIAYAKIYVHPTLSKEAADILKAFYLELRKQYHTESSIPVTTRQLQSLIRLTQARARLELREEATATDALDVVEIMKYSLVDTFSDEYGALDFTRSQNGSGVSKKSQLKNFLNILQKKAEFESKTTFSKTELKNLADQSGVTGFYDLLTSLNIQGFLLNKGNNNYQLQSVAY